MVVQIPESARTGLCQALCAASGSGSKLEKLMWMEEMVRPHRTAAYETGELLSSKD